MDRAVFRFCQHRGFAATWRRWRLNQRVLSIQDARCSRMFSSGFPATPPPPPPTRNIPKIVEDDSFPSTPPPPPVQNAEKKLQNTPSDSTSAPPTPSPRAATRHNSNSENWQPPPIPPPPPGQRPQPTPNQFERFWRQVQSDILKRLRAAGYTSSDLLQFVRLVVPFLYLCVFGYRYMTKASDPEVPLDIESSLPTQKESHENVNEGSKHDPDIDWPIDGTSDAWFDNSQPSMVDSPEFQSSEDED